MKRHMYFRPLLQSGPVRPDNAFILAGGWTWFTQVEVLRRDATPEIVAASELSEAELAPLISTRAPIAGLRLDHPHIMGILNVTPDSFSDGGQFASVPAALDHVGAMHGATILDIGGESTRPGAETVAIDEEINRTAPVIRALRAAGNAQVISVDTRKAPVAQAALDAGADLINDVAGFTFDPELAPLCAQRGVPVCVMHAQGDPATMQHDPHYEDVLLDVFDYLEARIADLVAQGIDRRKIIADPGIGFGKMLDHNLALLTRLSLFHSLGVPILLGASRKRFIGIIGEAELASDRMPGSIAVALAALNHGTQFVRVHDVQETAQAIALWRAVVAGVTND